MIARSLWLRHDDHLVPIAVYTRDEMRGQPLVIREIHRGGTHRAQFRLPAIEVCVDRLDDVTMVHVTIHRDGGSARIAEIAPNEHVLVHGLGRARGVFLGDDGIVVGGVVVKCRASEARTGSARRLGGWGGCRWLGGRDPRRWLGSWLESCHLRGRL